MLVLASASAGRARLLADAGVAFEVARPTVDEAAAKASLREAGVAPRALADALAELKARDVSAREGERLVLGCDQLLVDAAGETLDKPRDRDDAAAQLRRLRGRPHRLLSAAVLCRAGVALWRHVEEARLHVRDFSDAWLDRYLNVEWPGIGGCVGGYRIEGPGIQLFDRVEGSQWAIVGLPLVALLAQLRRMGEMPA